MPNQIFISDEVATAVWMEDGAWWSLAAGQKNPMPFHAGDVSLLLDCGARFRNAGEQGRDLRVLSGSLLTSQLLFNALFLVLSGANMELSPKARLNAQIESERLLEDPRVAEFVTCRLNSKPAPPEAAFTSSEFLSTLKEFARLKKLYSEVADSQNAIVEIWMRWNSVANTFFPNDQERVERIEARLVETGLLGQIVQPFRLGHTQAINSAFVGFMTNESTRRDPLDRNLLHAFRRSIQEGILPATKHLPQRISKTEEKRRRSSERPWEVSIPEMLASLEGKKRTSRMSGWQAKSQVDRQIAGISEMLFRGNTASAEKYLKDLITFQLGHSEREHVAKSLCALTAIALDANQIDFAGELVRHALELGLEDRVIYTTKAEVLKRAGKFEDAYAAYDEALSLFPDDRFSRNGRADVLTDMEKYDRALLEYGKVMAMFPDDPVAFNGRVGVLAAQGNLALGLQEAQANALRFPNDLVTQTVLAELWKRSGHPEKAVSLYSRMIATPALRQAGRRGVLTYNGLAQAQRAAGRLSDAYTTYQQARKNFPSDPIPLTGSANILRHMGRLEESLLAYKEALREFPAAPAAKYGLAAVYVLLGDLQEVGNIIADESPRSEVDWRSFHLLTMAHIRAGNLESAEARLRLGVMQAPWSKTRQMFWTSLGYLRIRRRAFSGASEALLTDINKLDSAKKQKRLLFLSHAQAELRDFGRARIILSAMGPVRDPNLRLASRTLTMIYGLSDPRGGHVPAGENQLTAQLQAAEFSLALAA